MLEIFRKINTLKSEHLKEGVKPIMASINDLYNLDEQTKIKIKEIEKNGEFVNYFEKEEYFAKNKMLNDGKYSYAISDINEKDKYSEEYKNCTGVILSGIDRQTGKNISFLSHQNPLDFLKSKTNFIDDLSKSIDSFIKEAEPKTIDAVIFGGNSHYQDDYVDSIEKINKTCKKKLGFEPVVLTGPNFDTTEPTHAFFDNQNRRLYLVRPNQEKEGANNPYLPSDIEKQEWNKK